MVDSAAITKRLITESNGQMYKGLPFNFVWEQSVRVLVWKNCVTRSFSTCTLHQRE
jgi:hypothetical protein